METEPTSASEDFGLNGTAWHTPSVFWFVGCTDPDLYPKAQAAGKLHEIPTNHNPGCAPVIHPTLETDVAALVVAALRYGWQAPQPSRGISRPDDNEGDGNHAQD